jgi:CheY-like chemotaxis protein
MDLAHDRDGRPGAGGRERCTLAGEAGSDDQHVVGGHGPQSIGGTRGPAPRRGRASWVANMTHGPSKRPVRVLVVDDHADVRFLIRAILADAGPDVAFAGEASGAREAVEALEHADPDVVVLDARMPGIDGFEAAGMLLERRPGLPILLCSAIVDDEIRSRAGAAGIAACISKDHFDAIPEKALQLAAGR